MPIVITLNEYTLAMLCGGVSCLTYLLLHIHEQRKRNSNLVPKEAVEDDEDEMDEDAKRAAFSASRRQSYQAAKFRSRRAESLKSDHVIFADEITADDEKFSPITNITDDQVEGILQHSENYDDNDSEKLDFKNIPEVPALNKFEETQPLDDLLIRRRSLHSSPAGSRSGSRVSSQRGNIQFDLNNDDDDDDDDDDENSSIEGEDSATHLEIVSLRKELASIREELSLKSQNQDLEKERHEKQELQTVLRLAMSKLYPDIIASSDQDQHLLDKFVQQLKDDPED